MGKKGKKGGITKPKKSSSGLKKMRWAQREIKRLRTKIKRWERYQAEIEAGKRSSPKRANRWNTAGLVKQIAQLEKVK